VSNDSKNSKKHGEGQDDEDGMGEEMKDEDKLRMEEEALKLEEEKKEEELENE
jgi:hypothetical protein